MLYRHSADMGEISGFGGDYEECCQDMLEAGMNWLNAKVDPELVTSEFENVHGIIIPESPDADDLSKVILEASKGEASGAMHHAVMSRLMWISKHSWDAYCAELRKSHQEEAQGSVTAGSSIQCGDVDGDARAGSSIQCGNIGGDVRATTVMDRR